VKNLSDRLKWARSRAGVSQAAVAEAVGISQPTYSDLEKGRQRTTGVLPQIAAFLGVEALWLAAGKGAPCEEDSMPSPPGYSDQEYQALVEGLPPEMVQEVVKKYLASLPKEEQVKRVKELIDQLFLEE
jgi:transcriptional regulator with XRE-family HTH domain